MLTNRFDNLQSSLNVTITQLGELENDATLNKNGFIYKSKKDQLTKKANHLILQLKQLGSDITIIEVTGEIYKNEILHSFTIKFSGISVGDAYKVVKLRYPTSFNINHKVEYTGKAKMEPTIAKK